MGLQDVKSDIIQKAEAKAEEIEKEAEEEKQRILEEAEEEAEEVRRKHEEELEDRKSSYERKKLSNARMKARQQKLQAKQEYLDRAFENFREQLEDLDEEEKEEYFENCVEDTSFSVGKVIGSPEFEQFTDEEFEERDIKGFVLVSGNGERRRDYTFERVVETFKDDYRKEVAEKLFGG